MQLPRNLVDYKEQVSQRVRVMCRSKLWSKTEDEVFRWLQNFGPREHEYLALHILDSLIFRTRPMMQAAYRRYLATHLRHAVAQYLELRPPGMDVWFNRLKKTSRKNPLAGRFFLSPVCQSGIADESAGVVLRSLHGGIVDQRYVAHLDKDCWQSTSGKVVLLVDDFLGSGAQFKQFADDVRLRDGARNNKIIYAPLMAFSEGLREIRAAYPEIEIEPIEEIHQSQGLFAGSPDDRFRNDEANSVADALACYQDIQTYYGFRSKQWLGRNAAALSLAFEWGCPNQSLTVLYDTNGPKGWYPLHTRRVS